MDRQEPDVDEGRAGSLSEARLTYPELDYDRNHFVLIPDRIVEELDRATKEKGQAWAAQELLAWALASRAAWHRKHRSGRDIASRIPGCGVERACNAVKEARAFHQDREAERTGTRQRSDTGPTAGRLDAAGGEDCEDCDDSGIGAGGERPGGQGSPPPIPTGSRQEPDTAPTKTRHRQSTVIQDKAATSVCDPTETRHGADKNPTPDRSSHERGADRDPEEIQIQTSPEGDAREGRSPASPPPPKRAGKLLSLPEHIRATWRAAKASALGRPFPPARGDAAAAEQIAAALEASGCDLACAETAAVVQRAMEQYIADQAAGRAFPGPHQQPPPPELLSLAHAAQGMDLRALAVAVAPLDGEPGRGSGFTPREPWRPDVLPGPEATPADVSRWPEALARLYAKEPQHARTFARWLDPLAPVVEGGVLWLEAPDESFVATLKPDPDDEKALLAWLRRRVGVALGVRLAPAAARSLG